MTRPPVCPVRLCVSVSTSCILPASASWCQVYPSGVSPSLICSNCSSSNCSLSSLFLQHLLLIENYIPWIVLYRLLYIYPLGAVHHMYFQTEAQQLRNSFHLSQLVSFQKVLRCRDALLLPVLRFCTLSFLQKPHLHYTFILFKVNVAFVFRDIIIFFCVSIF